jgi:hypothetical protein
MSDSVSATGVAPAEPTLVGIAAAPRLDAERLDVYRVALDFQSFCGRLVSSRC